MTAPALCPVCGGCGLFRVLELDDHLPVWVLRDCQVCDGTGLVLTERTSDVSR